MYHIRTFSFAFVSFQNPFRYMLVPNYYYYFFFWVGGNENVISNLAELCILRFKTHQRDNGYGTYWPPSGHGVELKMRPHPHQNVARVGFEPAPENLDTDYQPSALTTTPQSAPLQN